MSHKAISFTRTFAVLMLILSTSMSLAHADDDEDGQPLMVVNNKWKEECGACHVAYLPRFLPAESWRALMSGLDKHFGSNASLDEAAAAEITDFLVNNAVTRKNDVSGKPLLRISETRWFKSEHREVSARTWKNPKIKSPANCGACHTQADSGNFSERSLKIPK